AIILEGLVAHAVQAKGVATITCQELGNTRNRISLIRCAILTPGIMQQRDGIVQYLGTPGIVDLLNRGSRDYQSLGALGFEISIKTKLANDLAHVEYLWHLCLIATTKTIHGGMRLVTIEQVVECCFLLVAQIVVNASRKMCHTHLTSYHDPVTSLKDSVMPIGTLRQIDGSYRV